jgi:N-acetyl-anhydromuramyl-L-alanine amidase AmpD
MLGDSYLVDRRQRHIIIRDHVDLHELAQEIGVSSSWPGAARHRAVCYPWHPILMPRG